jgi:hypothetical protein
MPKSNRAPVARWIERDLERRARLPAVQLETRSSTPMTTDRRYYISVEVDAFGSPKLLPLGDALAFRYLGAIAWAHRHLTDGLVPRAAAAELRLTRRDVRALLAAGLFEVAPAGWQIHDYLRHQPSRADMRRRSQAASTAAGVRWAKPSASDPHPNRMRDASAQQSESDAHVLRRPTSDSETYPEGVAGERGRSRDLVARSTGLRPISGAVDRAVAMHVRGGAV